MNNPNPDWNHLPIEGRRVRHVELYGNGKDCEVTIHVANPDRSISFMMCDPHLEMDWQGEVQTLIDNRGSDAHLGIWYTPLRNMIVTLAGIDYTGEETEWNEERDDLESGRSDSVGWTIHHARLRFEPEQTPHDPADRG